MKYCVNLIIILTMRQFRIFWSLLVGVALFASCKQECVIIMTPFPIERYIEYSTYDTYGIFDPIEVVLSNKYLILKGMKSDPIFQQYELPNMHYVKSFGNRGRGPNEFSSPPMMYSLRGQEKIYISHSCSEGESFTGYLISENGDLIPQDTLIATNGNGLYNNYHIINDSLLVYNLLPNEFGIEKINLSTNSFPTKIQFTKNKHYKGEDFFHPDFGTLSVNNQYIVYVYMFRKQIDIYNLDDLTLKVRLLAKRHRQTITTSEQSKRYYYDVYVTENFIYAVYIDPDTDDKKNKYFVEVFDFNGTPVKRYNIGTSLWGMFAVSSDDSTMYSYNWELEKILKFDLAE